MAVVVGIDEERLRTLGARFSGVLLRLKDEGYEEARRVHNGLIDKRPALIARCRGTADIVEALALARETGLEVSIRGGGHNVAGRAVTEGGVMIVWGKETRFGRAARADVRSVAPTSRGCRSSQPPERI